jgi:hypothetical protein
VVRHVATALRSDEFDTTPTELATRAPQIALSTRAAAGNRRRMFQQPEKIGRFFGQARSTQATL